MPVPSYETLLQIYDSSNVSLLPLYSSRGIKQTLKFRDGAKSQRVTVNGDLVNLALTRMQKYSSTIEGSDMRPPSRDNIWPGRTVTIACAYVLQYPTSGGSPSRTPVSGSQIVEGNFTLYRPLMTFMIGDMHGTFDEWQAHYAWSIEMSEV
jgi:hypothetical protein